MKNSDRCEGRQKEVTLAPDTVFVIAQENVLDAIDKCPDFYTQKKCSHELWVDPNLVSTLSMCITSLASHLSFKEPTAWIHR